MIQTLASSAMKQQMKEIKKCLGVGRGREREREGEGGGGREREREGERERKGAVYPGGGGCSTKFCTGSPASRSNTYISFLREKVPLLYTFY